MAARQRGLKRALKLVNGLTADEAPFQLERADIAALSNVQVHSGPQSLTEILLYFEKLAC